MKFKNHFNREEFPTDHEVNTKPSETIPDQTMSIREIMERYARGLPISGAKVPVYHGEDEFIPNPKTIDLADMEAMKKAAAQEINDLRDNLQKNANLEKEKREKQKQKTPAPQKGGG